MNYMEKLLLTVYCESESKGFWADSALDGEIIEAEGDGIASIAEALREVDGFDVLNNGEPTCNVFFDGKNGEAIPSGYIFDTIKEIDGESARFSVWVTVKKVLPFKVREMI